jgi:hypothetical protein
MRHRNVSAKHLACRICGYAPGFDSVNKIIFIPNNEFDRVPALWVLVICQTEPTKNKS